MPESSRRSAATFTIPDDDPRRSLVIARPDADASLEHLALVGDTYTILLRGEDTVGLYCLIDMHIPPVMDVVAGSGASYARFRGKKSPTYSVADEECRAKERANLPSAIL